MIMSIRTKPFINSVQRYVGLPLSLYPLFTPLHRPSILKAKMQKRLPLPSSFNQTSYSNAPTRSSMLSQKLSTRTNHRNLLTSKHATKPKTQTRHIVSPFDKLTGNGWVWKRDLKTPSRRFRDGNLSGFVL